LEGQALDDKILLNIKLYNKVNYLGTIFSGCLFMHLLAKAIFNITAEIKLILDIWTILDIICSMFNIICFNVIGSVSVDQIKNINEKQILDIYVIAVTIVGWTRFFSYFLLQKRISKLVNTFIRMV
jgi:hypothetical protein